MTAISERGGIIDESGNDAFGVLSCLRYTEERQTALQSDTLNNPERR